VLDLDWRGHLIVAVHDGVDHGFADGEIRQIRNEELLTIR